jgi:hypothetical protein
MRQPYYCNQHKKEREELTHGVKCSKSLCEMRSKEGLISDETNKIVLDKIIQLNKKCPPKTPECDIQL